MQKVISVFFSGTGFKINDSYFLAAKLKNAAITNENTQVFGFNGCGVDYGLTGVFFGRGLDKQCRQVTQAVKKEIEAGHDVTLNVYGHSRGGVAAFMLAKQLSHLNPKQLEINLGVLDPVPGNFLSTAAVVPFDILLVQKVADLRECAPLKRVLALYPYKPLPAIACHAPMFARYPEATEVEEEVIPGCHAQAEQTFSFAGTIPFYRFYQFMQDCGTPFAKSLFKRECTSENVKALLLEEYSEHLNTRASAIDRAVHDSDVRMIHFREQAKYYNKHHAELLGQKASHDELRAYIAPSDSLYATLKRTLNAYPALKKTLNCILAGSLITMGLYFSGALGALALTAYLTETLGLLLTLSITAATCSGVSALISPLVYRGVEAISYPEFKMEQEIDSSQKMKFA